MLLLSVLKIKLGSVGRAPALSIDAILALWPQIPGLDCPCMGSLDMLSITN